MLHSITRHTHRNNSAVKNWFVEVIKCTSGIAAMVKRCKSTATERLQLQQDKYILAHCTATERLLIKSIISL